MDAVIRIYRAKAKFFGWKPAAENEKKMYLLNEKSTFLPSGKMKCPKSWIFTNNY